MILNILLLFVGTTATLSAFGGKTWLEGPGPVLGRVTARGWVSLACLLCALALGVVKEVTGQQKDLQAAMIAEKEKAELARQLNEAVEERADLTSRLSFAQTDLETANRELTYLRRNSRYQPTVTAAPVPSLRSGETVPLRHEPYAGSKLELLGFSCRLLVKLEGSVRREFPVAPMQHATLPVIGMTGERVRVVIRNLGPSNPLDRNRRCSGKVMVHSIPFLEE